MKRGYLDADSKMFALDIINGILEIVYMDVQNGQSNHPTTQPTTPQPILHTPSRLQVIRLTYHTGYIKLHMALDELIFTMLS